MIADYKITEIFCTIDEFCKELDRQMGRSFMSSSVKWASTTTGLHSSRMG